MIKRQDTGITTLVVAPEDSNVVVELNLLGLDSMADLEGLENLISERLKGVSFSNSVDLKFYVVTPYAGSLLLNILIESVSRVVGITKDLYWGSLEKAIESNLEKMIRILDSRSILKPNERKKEENPNDRRLIDSVFGDRDPFS